MGRHRYHPTELAQLQTQTPPWTSRNDVPCKTPGTNPDLWFEPHTETIAIAACGRCPIQPECATWATRTRQPHGVWGGTTRTDRIPPGIRRGTRSAA